MKDTKEVKRKKKIYLFIQLKLINLKKEHQRNL